MDAAIRFFIGGMFVWAGVGKMLDPRAFAEAIASFRMVPVALVSPMALAIPPLEVIAGGLWVANRGAASAAAVIGGLLGMFVVALVVALLRGIPAECGCFGASVVGAHSPGVALARDIVMAGAVIYWIAARHSQGAQAP